MGRKFLAPLLQPARSVCILPSVFSIHYCCVDADIQTTDPTWYQVLISPLNEEHRKDMEEVFRLAEQKKAAAGLSAVCPLIMPRPLGGALSDDAV